MLPLAATSAASQYAVVDVRLTPAAVSRSVTATGWNRALRVMRVSRAPSLLRMSRLLALSRRSSLMRCCGRPDASVVMRYHAGRPVTGSTASA